jgi:transcriptional regulator with XRE-family HTH domain
MPEPLNVIGPILRALRRSKGLTQEQVAARCQVRGFDLTRGTLAKIESQVRAVSDHEIPFLAAGIEAEIHELFPSKTKVLARKARNPKGTAKKSRR